MLPVAGSLPNSRRAMVLAPQMLPRLGSDLHCNGYSVLRREWGVCDPRQAGGPGKGWFQAKMLPGAM